jgi:RHS repeat-associated protein
MSGTWFPGVGGSRGRSPARGRRSPPGARAGARARVGIEPLEPRCLLALLGLAQQASRPDIASNVRTSLSYTQVGNDANPFHYDATPLSLTLPDGTLGRITNQADKTPARTRLDLVLDNTGSFAAGVPGPDFAVNGRVTVGAQVYDGTLLSAEALGVGFADAITKASAEFEVRLQVTGGLLTGAGAPYKVGDNLGVLIHQPGLTITRFPATFSFSWQTSGLSVGSSDVLVVPPQIMRLSSRQPLQAQDRNATWCPSVDAPAPQAPSCNCNGAGGNLCGGSVEDTGTESVSLYNGSVTYAAMDLTIPGRGMDWSLTRRYRSDLTFDGPLGHGWELNYDRRLEVVTPANLAKFRAAFPAAKVGDVDQIDGSGRDDLYVLNGDGITYTDPAGYFTSLTRNADGSFTERYDDGTVYAYRKADARGVATMSSMADRDGDTMRFVYDDDEKLTFVYDTMGRPIQYKYDASDRLAEVDDFCGRTVRFSYDAGGDLVSATSPVVTGTPNGNDFPTGKTERYTYSPDFKLTSITAPDEVANGGPPRVSFTYDTNPASPSFGRVMSQTEGGTNVSGVPAGGTMIYQYDILATPPPGDTTTPARRTTVIDRNGNMAQYQYNQLNDPVRYTEFANRGVRPGDPTSFTTQYTYDRDYRLRQVVEPLGNTTTYIYDIANPDLYQQDNLLSATRTPDAARGGDQSSITTTYTYEPIYNQVRTVTEPRGNDPGYIPQNGGARSAARYTTTYIYDYQEGTNFAALGAILGVGAAAAAARLAAAGIPMGLGDVNGDGRTDQVHGDRIRTQSPTVHLLPGSNEAVVEGTTLQPIVTTYAYNDLGQMTRMVDPERNVTTSTYYPESDPNGDGTIDNRSGNPTTGGYLRQTTEDASADPARDSGTNPTPTQIRHVYQYDPVGNTTRDIDGRGIATDYVYNQLNQVVQVVHAAAHGLYGTDPLETVPLTDFRYVERSFYDANNNLVLHQVEDRGNTSTVDGNPPAADRPVNAPNPDPAGGPAFVDTVYKYDLLDRLIETLQEVGGGEFLRTRYRYDPNGNQVLTIQPEGNATATIYDERDLPFRTARGVTTPPEAQPGSPTGTTPTLLAPSDPINYDVRGGAPCDCTTYRYDANRNVIETVDADDTDLSPANNDAALGPGDRTRYVYDGFDRGTSVIDGVGNQAVYQYDPAGNVVRMTRFGPVGGPSPTSDGPNVLPGPVSRSGVIQAGNLINSNPLAATEMSYDELGRAFQTSRVLFVQTIPTTRTPDVAEGAADLGKGALTPGQTQAIPGVPGVTVLGRVSDRTEYDRDSRPTFTIQDDLDTTRTFYDGAGRVVKTNDGALNNGFDSGTGAFQPANLAGNTVEMAYDDASNVIETRETDVAQVPGVANEIFLTTRFYDSLNRLQRTVDNIGQATDYRYDSRDNLVAMADAQGPTSVGTVLPINRRAFPGGPTTVNFINAFGNVTRYFYDGLDRRTRTEAILTPLSPTTAQGDGVHIGASIFGVKDDPTAPESFTPTPDPAQGGGDGIIRTGWNWDRNSLLSSLLDDQGNVTVYLYDDLDRRVTETKGLVVTSTLTKANILGAREIVTPTAATINNPGFIPATQIDVQLAAAAARLTTVAALFPPRADRVDDHPPTTIVWGYAPDDNVLILEDENDSETFTKYDAIDRPIAARVFRSGQADSFVGDPTFAPAPVSDPTHPSTTFPAVVGTNRQDFQYDGLSRITRAADNNDPMVAADDSVVTTAYDSLDRVIEEAQTIGGVPTKFISSAWRAEDLRSKLTYPNGRSEVYTYDRLDRLNTVADQGAALPIADYDYIGVDRPLQRLYPINGTRETYLDDSGTVDVGYDGLRRPVELRNPRSDNSLIVGFTYAYDRMNNKLTEGKLHDPANSESYAYDSAYRLIGFHRAPGGIAPLQSTWTLDGVGNWDRVDGETRQHSSFNEIISRDGTAIRSDDNGNETDDGTFLYMWDASDRLRTVSRKSDGMLVAAYTYDALDRRVQKVVTNSGALDGTTVFYLGGLQEIEERNGADALVQQYVFGSSLDEPLVLDRNLDGDGSASGASDQRLFYHQNAQNSVFALTGLTGRIQEGYQYEPYGRQAVFRPGPNGRVDFGGDDLVGAADASALNNPFLYTGRRVDAETGLLFYRSRYLDTVQGRFLSRDQVPAANHYEYAWSSPTNWTDALGLDPEWRDVRTAWETVAIEWETAWTEIAGSRVLKRMGSFPHYECLLYVSYQEWIHTREKQIEKKVQERTDPAALKKIEDQIDKLIAARDAADQAAADASQKSTGWYATAGALGTQALSWGFISSLGGGPIAWTLTALYGAGAIFSGAMGLYYSGVASSYQSQATKARDQIADLRFQITSGKVPKETREIPTGQTRFTEWSKWRKTINTTTIAWRVPLRYCFCPWIDPDDITKDIAGNKIVPPKGSSGSRPVNPPRR